MSTLQLWAKLHSLAHLCLRIVQGTAVRWSEPLFQLSMGSLFSMMVSNAKSVVVAANCSSCSNRGVCGPAFELVMLVMGAVSLPFAPAEVASLQIVHVQTWSRAPAGGAALTRWWW